MDSIFFTLLSKFSYVGLFLVLLAAGLGVPLPEDIPLVAAGWLVHTGRANLYLMMLVGLAGVMAGDSLMFRLGRKYGVHIVEHRWVRRFAKPWLLEKARQKYATHGAKILFAARFMPGLRSPMFVSAGVFGVPFWKFFLIDGFAALISVPVWVWVGWKFSGHIEQILGSARMATYCVVGALVVALALWGVWEYRHNLRKRSGAARVEDVEKILSAPLVPPVEPGSPPSQPVASPPVSPRPETVGSTSRP